MFVAFSNFIFKFIFKKWNNKYIVSEDISSYPISMTIDDLIFRFQPFDFQILKLI